MATEMIGDRHREAEIEGMSALDRVDELAPHRRIANLAMVGIIAWFAHLEVL